VLAVRFSRTDYSVLDNGASSRPEAVALADLDGTAGPPDIVASLQGTSKIGVLLNNGDGTFGAMKTCASACGPVYDVHLADYINAAGSVGPDGNLDAIVACPLAIEIFPGDGHGGFGAPHVYPVGIAQAGTVSGEGAQLLALVGFPNVVHARIVFEAATPQLAYNALCFTDDLLSVSCSRNGGL
jgi:hypothetical protein